MFIALTAVFACAKTPPRGRTLARPAALGLASDAPRLRLFVALTAVFANAKTPPRGRTLASGGPWPCLGRSASSVYEDTSSLLLLSWRKTVEGSTLFTAMQNRCPYRQVCLLLLGWRKTVEGSALFTVLQNRCPCRQASDERNKAFSPAIIPSVALVAKAS